MSKKQSEKEFEEERSFSLFWSLIEIGNGKEGTNELKRKYQDSSPDSSVRKDIENSYAKFRAAELEAKRRCLTGCFPDILEAIADILEKESSEDIQTSETAIEKVSLPK